MNKTEKGLLLGAIMLCWVAGGKEALALDGQLTLGTEFSYFKYEEPDVMEETGPLYGITGEYVLRTAENDPIEAWEDIFTSYKNNYMFALEGRFAFGQLDYDSQTTGSIDDIDEYLLETRGIAGYDFPAFEETLFTVYTGVGYRYLDDNLGGKTSTTGHLGYDRESYYVYLPFGLKAETPINERWSWGAGIEYDLFIHGKQKSHLEDVHPSLSTLENDQEEGFGVRGSLQFVRETENWDLLLEPFVRYWDVDESNEGVITCGGTPCAAGYEPKNESIEYGLKLGAKF